MSAPLEWTVRQRKEGGDLRPLDSKFGRPEGYSKLTIWIHGFNNTEYAISDIWEQTHTRARELSNSQLRGTVWFFWPGESSAKRGVSAALYFMDVRTAVQAGDALAAYLAAIEPENPGLKVNLVAHSLGSRVALQAAKRLKSLDGPKVETLLLFAAATAEGLCAPGGPYADRLAEREIILFSRDDAVLKRFFRPGQRMARLLRGEVDPGELKDAIGFSGGPPQRWEKYADSCGYGHSDYWLLDQGILEIARLARNQTTPKLPRERLVAGAPRHERLCQIRTLRGRHLRA
ncbi:pimeloyl-ACP methyl ester carboxylesterase [Nocardioides sp. BE266]|uniref:alpha/beta hydrolase n=1 Tax=Nocardioides sp. BE266 TaxID=2817725 RepID=UPI00285F4D0A|nr:pimeloyl-ACP methyl ester carboxylesterase [Nocardioides sp. BE266]